MNLITPSDLTPRSMSTSSPASRAGNIKSTTAHSAEALLQNLGAAHYLLMLRTRNNSGSTPCSAAFRQNAKSSTNSADPTRSVKSVRWLCTQRRMESRPEGKPSEHWSTRTSQLWRIFASTSATEEERAGLGFKSTSEIKTANHRLDRTAHPRRVRRPVRRNVGHEEIRKWRYPISKA